MFKKFVITIGMIFCSLESRAYIPSIAMILSRVAANHGKGSYLIQNEVHFKSEVGNITLLEKWVVADGRVVRLDVTGGPGAGPVKIVQYFQKEKKSYFHESRGVVAEDYLPGSMENLIFVQSGDQLIQQMKNMGLLPGQYQKRQKTYKARDGYYFVEEKEVQLGRMLGSVVYLFQPSIAQKGDELLPSLWVEQDQFHIRKARWNDGAEANFDQYTKFAEGLWIPKVRTVKWSQGSAEIVITRVTPLVGDQKQKATLLEPLTVERKRVEPIQEMIREFYSRFR